MRDQSSRRTHVALGLAAAGLLGIVALGPALAPHDPIAVDFGVAMQGPSNRFPLGTDQFGRCTLSRLLHGGRTTVGTALVLTALCFVAAVVAAALSSVGPRWSRAVVGRVVDIGAALPSTVIAIAVVGWLGPGMWTLMIGLAVTEWTEPSRSLAGLVSTELRSGHVFAARVLGATRTQLLARDVLPAVLGPLALVAAAIFAHSLLNVAALSFIGLGTQPPAPEWGAMLGQSRTFYFTRPQLLVAPAVAITATIGLAYAVTHALDAHLTRRAVER